MQLQALAPMASPAMVSWYTVLEGASRGASWESNVPAGDRVLWGEGSLRKAAASSTNVGVPAASCESLSLQEGEYGGLPQGGSAEAAASRPMRQI